MKRGVLTLICGIIGVLITKDAIGLFVGFLIGFLIEWKLGI
jgi:hypothetical protein